MGSTFWVCSRCKQPSPQGTRYCPHCGEALDPALIAELHELYRRVQVLDALAAAGEGGETVADLRERYRTRYLSLRSAAPSTAQSATMPAEHHLKQHLDRLQLPSRSNQRRSRQRLQQHCSL